MKATEKAVKNVLERTSKTIGKSSWEKLERNLRASVKNQSPQNVTYKSKFLPITENATYNWNVDFIK